MKMLLFKGKNLFFPSILVSAAGHLALFAVWGFNTGQPNYSVEIGPNTFEVVSMQVSQPQSNFSERVANPSEAEKLAVPTEFSETQNIPQVISSKTMLGVEPRVQPKALVSNPAPQYPQKARQKGWEGTVELKALVKRDGRPERVLITKSSGHSLLDSAALQTVESWQFYAARRGDTMLGSWVRVPIRFSLTDAE